MIVFLPDSFKYHEQRDSDRNVSNSYRSLEGEPQQFLAWATALLAEALKQVAKA